MKYPESQTYNPKQQLLWTVLAIFVSVVTAVVVSSLLVKSIINDKVAAAPNAVQPVVKVVPVNTSAYQQVPSGNNCYQPSGYNYGGKGGMVTTSSAHVPVKVGNKALIKYGGKGGVVSQPKKTNKSSVVNKTTTTNKIYQKTTYNKDSNNSYDFSKYTKIEDSFNKDSYNNTAINSFNKDSYNKDSYNKTEDSYNTDVDIDDSFNKTYNKNSHNEVKVEDSFNKNYTKQNDYKHKRSHHYDNA